MAVTVMAGSLAAPLSPYLMETGLSCELLHHEASLGPRVLQYTQQTQCTCYYTLLLYMATIHCRYTHTFMRATIHYRYKCATRQQALKSQQTSITQTAGGSCNMSGLAQLLKPPTLCCDCLALCSTIHMDCHHKEFVYLLYKHAISHQTTLAPKSREREREREKTTLVLMFLELF